MMHKKGYVDFTITRHTELWKSRCAKDPKYQYGVYIAEKWYWYDSWVKEVEKYCWELYKK